MLLSTEEFAPGWQEYEWRWKTDEFRAARRDFKQPRWDGGDLGGRTILLYHEQGLGDTLQVARYLPLVAQRGGKVIVDCQRELQRLLKSPDGEWQILAENKPLPAFDIHFPFMSLPQAFWTTPQTIPGALRICTPIPRLRRSGANGCAGIRIH